MDRRARIAVIGAIVAMVVLVLAASSGPVDVWRSPDLDGGSAPVVTDPPTSVVPQEPLPEGKREMPDWVATLSKVIGIVVGLVIIAAALAAMRLVRMPTLRWPTSLKRRAADGATLPEVDDGIVSVDVDSARAALGTGPARNAIVACWMQLERDAADAGLPRLPFETATEYVERVIGASSVDPAPIGELAALYREARFSQHELGDAHRARALAALERVEVALRRADAEATS
jgi:hypothetical protein